MSAIREVPFFRYPSVFTDHEEEFVRIFREVGRRGAFIKQRDLTEFENKLAAFTGAKYAIGVGNATDALEMLIKAAGVKPGDEVIVSSHTMLATASAVVANGATPVPVDPGDDHLLDPDSARKSITRKTKAILPTNLNGRTCDMDAILKLVADHGLLLLEDAAQALGSRFKGKHAGTFGFAGCISFYPAKTLGCLGDGGAIICNDEAAWSKMVRTCDHGRDPVTAEVSCWGRNSRMDNLQAAFLSHLLDSYQNTIDRRRAMARIYDAELSWLEALRLPPSPDAGGDHYDIFQNYEIEAERRDELKAFLLSRGVGTLLQWGGVAIHQLRQLGFTQQLPRTDERFKRLLMLPMNLSLSDDEVRYVCEQIRAFYA